MQLLRTPGPRKGNDDVDNRHARETMVSVRAVIKLVYDIPRGEWAMATK